MKKTATLVIIAMALSLSACNNNETEIDKKPSTDGSAQQQSALDTKNNTDNYEESISTKAQDTVPTEDESPTPDESLYAYYDLLNEEYEKYGITSPVSPYSDFYYSSKENTITIYTYSKSSIVDTYYNIITHNIETKSTKQLTDYPMSRSSNAKICNDILYSTGYDSFWKGKLYVERYDFTNPESSYYITFEGENEIWDSSIDQFRDLNIFSQPDGTVFLKCFMGLHEIDECFMISPDGEKLTVLPKLEIEVAHGIKEPTDYSILACYNNTLFVRTSDYDFYCLDANKLIWEKLNFDLSTNKNSIHKSVGRYLLFGNAIYDMETKEVLVQNLKTSGFAYSYYGGKYNIGYGVDGKWYLQKYPSDGSAVNSEETKVYDMNKENFTEYFPINDKYYIVKDKYGFFLRSYEKGVEEEETIYLKPQS